MARIIVIDDEADLRALLRAILATQNHEIDEAENGALARKALREHQYDLIITDVLMPEEDGFMVVRESLKLQSDAKILAISGGMMQSGVDVLEIAKRLGANKVLSKPFDIQDLIQSVRMLLEP